MCVWKHDCLQFYETKEKCEWTIDVPGSSGGAEIYLCVWRRQVRVKTSQKGEKLHKNVHLLYKIIYKCMFYVDIYSYAKKMPSENFSDSPSFSDYWSSIPSPLSELAWILISNLDSHLFLTLTLVKLNFHILLKSEMSIFSCLGIFALALLSNGFGTPLIKAPPIGKIQIQVSLLLLSFP